MADRYSRVSFTAPMPAALLGSTRLTVCLSPRLTPGPTSPAKTGPPPGIGTGHILGPEATDEAEHAGHGGLPGYVRHRMARFDDLDSR